MLKYSDVLNGGRRSAENYFEQVLRCPGDIPLNVFASVNNRWIIGDHSMHASLEREFLSGVIARKAARFRNRVLHGHEAVVFTRAGALLNLKVLLATERPLIRYRPSALGAVALHANDYVESMASASIATGTLPVVAEFAPVWELQNIREPMQLLRRSYFIYSTLLQRDARMQSLFDAPIRDLGFGGLPFRKYFPLLFGIYTATRNGVLDERFPTSIPPAIEVAQQAGVTVEQFARFAETKAITASKAAEAFGPLDRTSFVDRVTNSAWASDQRLFRNQPLVQLGDERFLTVDLQFLFESTSAGLSWSLAQQLTGKARDHFFEYWGHLFEEYTQLLLAHYFGIPIKRTYGSNGQIDGVLNVGDDVIVFEVKAGFVREEAKGSRDPVTLDAALREKFVRGKKGPKAVQQLAASVEAVLSGKLGAVTGRVYPVFVGEDPILQTIVMNTYLNDIFREETSVGGRVAPLTVLLIDELELVLPHLSAGDLSWQELLSSRFVGDRVAKDSMHEAFYTIASERNLQRRQETFLASHASELIKMVTDAYKDLK